MTRAPPELRLPSSHHPLVFVFFITQSTHVFYFFMGCFPSQTFSHFTARARLPQMSPHPKLLCRGAKKYKQARAFSWYRGEGLRRGVSGDEGFRRRSWTLEEGSGGGFWRRTLAAGQHQFCWTWQHWFPPCQGWGVWSGVWSRAAVTDLAVELDPGGLRGQGGVSRQLVFTVEQDKEAAEELRNKHQ